MSEKIQKILGEKIGSIEDQMLLKLKEARATFAQSGDKGTSAEHAFRKFLREFIPGHLRIGHGEIMDLQGQRSPQTDIVIVSEDHPFTFTEELPGLFFIEGVRAAGEVKSNLTGSLLADSLESSLQFKRLTLDPGKGTQIHSNPADLERFSRNPPWFICAFESQLRLQTINEKISEFVHQKSVQQNRLVDAVFVLDKGWVINFGDGKGSVVFRNPEGKSVEGWVWTESDSVLFDLLGWLHSVMPLMVRFEPILTKYLIIQG